MASSVPALLAKIACFRPRVLCFIGKGIWLHVERALSSLLRGDKNAGICVDRHPVQPSILVDAHGHVDEPGMVMATKDERSPYFHLVGDTPAIAHDQRLSNTGPTHLDPHGKKGKLEDNGSDVSSKQHPISPVKDPLDPMVARSTSPRSAARPRSISSVPRTASGKHKTPPAPVFVYGIQPYKVIHDEQPHVS